jgi:hypothetical protein
MRTQLDDAPLLQYMVAQTAWRAAFVQDAATGEPLQAMAMPVCG